MVTIARNIIFKPTKIENYQSSNGRCMQSQDYIKFDGDFNGTRRVVSSITISSQDLSAYLNTDANPSTPYTPLYPGSPTTKQYVDQHDTVVSATAPSTATEGMLWYDTTNDVLKSYNGSAWVEVGNESEDINTKTFYVQDKNDLTTAQAVLDWHLAGKNPLIVYLPERSATANSGVYYFTGVQNNNTLRFVSADEWNLGVGYSRPGNILYNRSLGITFSGTTATGYDPNTTRIEKIGYLSTISQNDQFIPTQQYHPATKRYVDDKVTTSATAPLSPTEGMIWYDTTNDVLKVYNGTTWNTIATGGSISDTAYGSGWDGQTTIAPSQNAVYDKISTMDTAISSNTTNINTINNKIPSEASSSNQLADKAYVGDSINSVTAYYITKSANGDQFATYAELASATTFYSGGVVRTPTKNDYTIVLDDENHDHATTRYIYNNGWEYQYTVNETPLTQAQLNALNSGITAAKVAKYDTLNTREFTLSDVGSSATVLAEAQEVFDWINAGNFAILKIATDSGQPTYLYKATTVDDVRFLSSDMVDGGYSDNFTTAMQKGVEIHYSGTTVTGVSYINNLTWQFLAINGQYQSAFMPTQDAHPATKKYVDSKSTVVSATAPSSPTEGMLWYDTTNDVLKTYNGTNWIEVGVESNTKTFYLTTGTSSSALQKAQECYDWYKSGKNPIVSYNGINYILAKIESTRLTFQSTNDSFSVSNNSTTLLRTDAIYLSLSGDSVTAVYTTLSNVGKLLATDVDYSTPYTPLYDGSPATKKYVDDHAGTTYNAGPGIEIGTFQDYSAVKGPCPEGFHVPTVGEFQNVINACQTLGFTTGTDISTYLKLPKCGVIYGVYGSYSYEGYAFYWTNTAPYSTGARYLYIDSNDAVSFPTGNGSDWNANHGRNVRPFYNEVIIPDNSWDVIWQDPEATGMDSAGIYHNPTLGLISISGDGETWITISDKNAGANTVYNYGDTFSTNNCGNFYQRGNTWGLSYDDRNNSSLKSQDQNDTTGYSWRNPIYFTHFVTNRGRRWNAELWGAETGVITIDNAITNTGVLSVNGQTGDVTIGSIQLAPNSEYNIKYHWYGKEDTYRNNLQQYYTDEEGDTAYFTTEEEE